MNVVNYQFRMILKQVLKYKKRIGFLEYLENYIQNTKALEKYEEGGGGGGRRKYKVN